MQLDSYVVQGVGLNMHFLRTVLTNPRFVEGKLSTAFITEEYPDGFSGVKLTPVIKQRMAAIAAAMSAQWCVNCTPAPLTLPVLLLLLLV